MNKQIIHNLWRATGLTLTDFSSSHCAISRSNSHLFKIGAINAKRWFSSEHKVQRDLSDEDELLCTVQNGVRKITLNRPAKKNAITLDMFRGIKRFLEESNDDKNTTVIAITGNGDFFTSGIDMSSAYRKPDAIKTKPSSQSLVSESKPTTRTSPVLPLVNGFLNCTKPIIALVNGPAIGVGVTILGLVDGVYASTTATFQTHFSRFGLPPDVGSTFTLPFIMGYGRTNRILLCSQKISAVEALEFGLVSRVIEKENFCKETDEILQSYGELPVASLIYAKELMKGAEFRKSVQEACEAEQRLFDPSVAKKIKEMFMLKMAKKAE